MFKSIDDLITDWAASHHLAWSRRYRDEDVRSMDLPLGGGRAAQLWLEPATDGFWNIRAWDRKRENFSLVVPKAQLGQGLSDALAMVKLWAPA